MLLRASLRRKSSAFPLAATRALRAFSSGNGSGSGNSRNNGSGSDISRQRNASERRAVSQQQQEQQQNARISRLASPLSSTGSSPAVAAGALSEADALAQWALLLVNQSRGNHAGSTSREQEKRQSDTDLQKQTRSLRESLVPKRIDSDVARDAVQVLLRRERTRRLHALEEEEQELRQEQKRRLKNARLSRKRATTAVEVPTIKVYPFGATSVGADAEDADAPRWGQGLWPRRRAMGDDGGVFGDGIAQLLGSGQIGRQRASRAPPPDWHVSNRDEIKAKKRAVRGWMPDDVEPDSLSQSSSAVDRPRVISLDVSGMSHQQQLQLLAGKIAEHVGELGDAESSSDESPSEQSGAPPTGWHAVAPLVRDFVWTQRQRVLRSRGDVEGASKVRDKLPRRHFDHFANVDLATSRRVDSSVEPLRYWERDDELARIIGAHSLLHVSDQVNSSITPAFTFATVQFVPFPAASRRQIETSVSNRHDVAALLLGRRIDAAIGDFFSAVPTGEVGAATVPADVLASFHSNPLVHAVGVHMFVYDPDTADVARQANEARVGASPLFAGSGLQTLFNAVAAQRRQRTRRQITAGPVSKVTEDPIARVLLSLATSGGVWEISVVSQLSALESGKVVEQVFRSVSVVTPSVRESQRARAEEAARLEVFDRAELKPGESWCLVSEEWLSNWRRYIVDGGAPPGPIDNSCLLKPGSRSSLKHELQRSRDYRILVPGAWRALHRKYGGGPLLERSPDVLDKESGHSAITQSQFPDSAGTTVSDNDSGTRE